MAGRTPRAARAEARSARHQRNIRTEVNVRNPGSGASRGRRGVILSGIALTLLLAMHASNGVRAAQSTGPNGAVLAPINAVLNAGQSGNFKMLHDQYIAGCTIIDDFAPFKWSGVGAVDAYFASYGKMAIETKMTGTKISDRQQPKYVYVSGSNAYVLMPITVTAKFDGKPYTETGSIAFTLKKTDAGWKIATQTWVKTSETFNPY